MTLDSLPDLDTSGLCLVKNLPTALTCWPYRNMALRDGARNIHAHFVGRQREDGLDTLPARAAEANPKHSHRGHPVHRPARAGDSA